MKEEKFFYEEIRQHTLFRWNTYTSVLCIDEGPWFPTGKTKIKLKKTVLKKKEEGNAIINWKSKPCILRITSIFVHVLDLTVTLPK